MPSQTVKRFVYAWRGLARAAAGEQSFQIELTVALVVQVFSFAYGFSVIEWSVVTIASALVLAAELVNTALERMLDVIEPRLSAHVKSIKDTLAASVLVLSIAAVALFVGILIID